VCFPLTCFWRERADRLLENAYLGEMRSGLSPERCVRRDGDRECSLLALKDHVGLHLIQYLLSYKSPALLWAGVRGETHMNSTSPVGGSV
jgi:hypothetical protein